MSRRCITAGTRHKLNLAEMREQRDLLSFLPQKGEGGAMTKLNQHTKRTAVIAALLILLAMFLA